MPQTSDIMIYDDERTCLKTISEMIKNHYSFHSIKTEDNIFSMKFDLAINRPKLLILDYKYEGNLNLNYVMPTLKKFKGVCIIYSCLSKEHILSEIGDLPHNFYFVQKGNVGGLRNLLDRFIPACRSNTKKVDCLVN